MSRAFTVILTLSVVVAFAVRAVSQTCSLKTSPGKPDAEFNSIFTQNGPGQGLEPANGPGWVGADSTYSILLPNGDSAFFFSDSYIAEHPTLVGDGTATTGPNGLRRRVPNCNPPVCQPPMNVFRARNSIVIRDHKTGQLKTLVGPKDADGFSTSYFTPPTASTTKHHYWLADASVVKTKDGQKLWLVMMEFDSKLAYYGSALAQLSLPDLKIDSLRPVRGTGGSTVAWGTSLLLEGEGKSQTLYIYGLQNQQKLNGKVPYVARVNPSLGFECVVDATNWTAWNGSDWVSNLLEAKQLLGAKGDPNTAGDQISDEFNVEKFRTRKGSVYILVGMDTSIPFGKWKDITIYFACRPQGPFSTRQVVYSTPEAESPKVPGMTATESLAGPLLVYNPHLHPQFTNKNGVIISYNINTTKGEDLLYPDSYRPRFIRVPIDGVR